MEHFKKTVSETEIYTFEPVDKESKAILQYLSSKEEYKKPLDELLRSCGSRLLILAKDKVEAEATVGSQDNESPEQSTEKCMKDFFSLFASWNELLDITSSDDRKYIISVLSKYKARCHGSLWNETSTIVVTGPKEIVDELKKLVLDHLNKRCKALFSSPGTKSQSYDYTDVHPAILRFVSRNKHFISELGAEFKNLAYIEIKGMENNLTVHVTPAQNSAELLHDEFEKRCRIVLQTFFSRLDTWKETFDPEILKIHRSKAPDLFKPSSYPDHFVKWFYDTGMVNVTGTRQQVQRCKTIIKDMFKSPSQLTPRASPPPKSPSPHAKAKPYQWNDVQPDILKFVSKQHHFLVELRTAIGNLAECEVKWKEKYLSLYVTPTQNSSKFHYDEFEKRSKNILQKFFSRFDTWKGNFDPAAVEIQKARSPELFKESSYPDHFVKWYYDSGVVNVTGTCQQVQRCKKFIKDMLEPPALAPPPASPPSSIFAQIGVPAYDTSGKLSYILLHPPPSDATLPIGSAPGNLRANSEVKAPSAHSTIARPVSPRSNVVHFVTRKIPPAVLSFVLSDSMSRSKLENCKEKLARVVIKQDRTVDIIFNQKTFTWEEKNEVITAVNNYFEKFRSKMMRLDMTMWKKVIESDSGLFFPGKGLYISTNQDKGTVKITGLKENVLRRVEEINNKIHVETESEELPVDVFIAQRECGVWKEVEERCSKQADAKISITSETPGIIQFLGQRDAIEKAKILLGEVSEELCEKELENMSENQLGLLKKCGESQQAYFETSSNMLDTVYAIFRDNSVPGSLAFNDSCVKLISSNALHWRKGNKILLQSIICFENDLSCKKMEIPFTKLCKVLEDELKEFVAFVEERIDLKKIIVSCLKNDEAELKRKVSEIISKACEVKEIEKFDPMPEEQARYIAARHNLYKAKSVKAEKRNGQFGLLVTCEEEDLDTVEMKLEDLKPDIVKINERMSGYGLYEHLSSDKKHLKVEEETKCSIFLKPNQQVPLIPNNSKSSVIVKVGNILDEDCESIVNSTGESVSFSGQLSKAILGKYGSNILNDLMQHAQWIVEGQVCLCSTKELGSISLPWKYILNVATPEINQLKEFLVNILKAADKHGIKSMALPTIGTGGMGMDSYSVGIRMKEAVHEFCFGEVSNLKDIRVVVYEASALPAFKDIALTPKSAGLKSSGLIATIWGNSTERLEKAAEKFKELCQASIGSATVGDLSSNDFPALKSQAQDICSRHGVKLEWRNNGVEEQCNLQGILENVRSAEKEIKSLFKADIPHYWTPMDANKPFVKQGLHETSREYLSVKTKFSQSSPRYSKILKIERIQNPDLYRLFKRKEDITKKNNLTKSVTQQLFHGTRPDKIDKICGSGFDRNFAGENGTVYGRGVYFAVNSSYSVNYAGSGPTKYLFLAEVITGDYAQGKGEYKAPPEIRPGVQYDSVVDNTGNPTIYVVFRDSSVYPMYLITFE